MKICYHGTDTPEKAASIQASGFHPGTWFAANLQDALGFGGNHVFEVMFPFEEAPNWQFIEDEPVGKDRIVRYTEYEKKIHLDNMKLRLEIFQHNMHRDVGEY
jgi:hypothetical protein